MRSTHVTIVETRYALLPALLFMPSEPYCPHVFPRAQRGEQYFGGDDGFFGVNTLSRPWHRHLPAHAGEQKAGEIDSSRGVNALPQILHCRLDIIGDTAPLYDSSHAHFVVAMQHATLVTCGRAKGGCGRGHARPRIAAFQSCAGGRRRSMTP